MNAVILATGDELVLGQNVDTNSAWLSARLAEHGVMTRCHKTVGDDLDDVVTLLQEAARAADLVILTGGLGPTQDDLTRDAFARVLGTPLETHEPSLKRIEALFRSRGWPMADTNRVQALCPRGAEMLDNDWGTAPGLHVRIGPARVFAFPGVPREMMPMFDRYVVPVIRSASGRTILTEALRTFGVGESRVAEDLGDLMRRDRNPLVGTTASAGIVTVRVRSDFPAEPEAREALADTVRQVEARLGRFVYGRGEVTLAQVTGELLKKAGKTVATAESCTGGLVAKLLTDIPGSSAYCVGGWVVYANEMKTAALGVPAELIRTHGAVSEPVARAMGEQAILKSGADYALALTGIAGPDGGTADKPVGTVWIAMARKNGGGVQVEKAERFQFPPERDLVRERAAKTALNMLRMELLEAESSAE